MNPTVVIVLVGAGLYWAWSNGYIGGGSSSDGYYPPDPGMGGGLPPENGNYGGTVGGAVVTPAGLIDPNTGQNYGHVITPPPTRNGDNPPPTGVTPVGPGAPPPQPIPHPATPGSPPTGASGGGKSSGTDGSAKGSPGAYGGASSVYGGTNVRTVTPTQQSGLGVAPRDTGKGFNASGANTSPKFYPPTVPKKAPTRPPGTSPPRPAGGMAGTGTGMHPAKYKPV